VWQHKDFIMKAKGIHLAWINVKDIEKAIAFYTKVVGLEVREYHKEYRWAELSGPEGMILGIGEDGDAGTVRPGANAVLAVSVANMDEAHSHFVKNGAELKGDIVEIPGHVKLQTFVDPDGNTLQLAQKLASL
jgi:predicted enzyme related to lactoylglutathione lyase